MQFHRRPSHAGADGAHLHFAVEFRPFLIPQFLITLNVRFLFRASGSRPAADPFQLYSEDRLTFALRSHRHLFPLGFQLQITGIVGLITVKLSFIDLYDPVGHTVQKISVMGNHDQRAFPAFQIIFQPGSHALIQMVGRLVQDQQFLPAKKGCCQSRPFALSARQLSCFLGQIGKSKLREHGFCFSFNIPAVVRCRLFQHIVQHALFHIQLWVLGKITHDNMIGTDYRTAVRFFFAGNDTQQRGFTGSVDSYNTYFFALLHRKGSSVKEQPVRVGFCQIFYRQNIHSTKNSLLIFFYQ